MWPIGIFAGLFALFFPKQTQAGFSTIGRAVGETFGPPAPPVNARDVDTMARTIWGEARGEGIAGMQAVACVIMNRVKYSKRKGGFWWGNTIHDVCTKAYQFSVWLKNDPNYKRMIAVTKADPLFALAYQVAEQAANGHLNDITGGADHYHTKAINPAWARNARPIKSIGYHVFYRLENA